MKNILLILFCFIAVTVRAQYIPNATSYQWKGGEFLNSLQIPTGCGQPVTAISAPDGSRAALFYDSCNAAFYHYDPKLKAWRTTTGGGIDSIFITHSDSIFIITSNKDTVYVGVAQNFQDTTYMHADSLFGFKNSKQFFVGKVGGAVPTLQQVTTAGNTTTTNIVSGSQATYGAALTNSFGFGDVPVWNGNNSAHYLFDRILNSRNGGSSGGGITSNIIFPQFTANGQTKTIITSINGAVADSTGNIAINSGGISGTGLTNRLPYWSGATALSAADSIFIDNSIKTAPKIGFGTNSPTSTITLDSSRGAFGKGIALYRTTDQTINYSRLAIYALNTTGFILSIEKAGTIGNQTLYLNSSNTAVQTNGDITTSGQVNGSNGNFSGFVSGSQGYMNNISAIATNGPIRTNTSNSASSGQSIGVDLAGAVGQSGTAGYTAARISPFFSGTGSGTYNLLEVGENSNSAGNGTQTNSFVISRAGVVSILRNTLNLAAGTVSQSPLNIPAGIYESVPASGDIENNGTSLRYTNSGGTSYYIPRAASPGGPVIKRTTSISSSATPTPNAATDDMFIISALATSATFGSPGNGLFDGQELTIRVKDNGTAQTMSWNAIYRASSDMPLILSTTAGKTCYLKFHYNATDGKWDLTGIINNF